MHVCAYVSKMFKASFIINHYSKKLSQSRYIPASLKGFYRSCDDETSQEQGLEY